MEKLEENEKEEKKDEIKVVVVVGEFQTSRDSRRHVEAT